MNRNDIAKEAGVSPSTVSRALAGSPLLPESTIARVRAIAERLGYHPNFLARRLAANRSFQIGLVAPLGIARKGTFQMSYFSAILDGMVAAAYRHGYSLGINPFEGDDTGQVERLKDLALSKQVDGLALIGLKSHSRVPGKLSRAGVPVALIGASSSAAGVASVNCDPAAGIAAMLVAAAARGYRDLVYVGGNADYHDAVAQRKALTKTLPGSGLKLVETLPGNYSRRSGYAAAEVIFGRRWRRRPCVFLANDRMATGFYRYCQERAVLIPAAVGVVGSDDDEAATALYPDLSTINQPRRAMGEAAVEAIMKMLGGERSRPVNIETSFVERSSL